MIFHKNAKKLKNTTLLSLATLFLFTTISCEQPSCPEIKITPIAVNMQIIGTWESSYNELFSITSSTFTNKWGSTVSYEGDTVHILPITKTSGTIFIKYTTATYGTEGNWYAISYKDLTASSVKLSGAWKSGGKTGTPSLDEAIDEFTIADGYFAFYSECTKQP